MCAYEPRFDPKQVQYTGIVVVERREHDDFVTRVQRRHGCTCERAGGSDRHHHLALGVRVDSVERLHLVGDG